MSEAAVSSRSFVHGVENATTDGERLRYCLQCGSCSGVCPFASAMDYPPRRLIAALRADDLAPAVDSNGIWLCVSCFACTAACPAKIPLTDGVLANLKAEKLLRGCVPEELKVALENSRRYGNTLGESPRKRSEWARDFIVPVNLMAKHKQPVDVLWFVGDYASYHPRVQRITRAMAKILGALDVDFGILGPEEQSCGDVQLLAGERGLFELLARKNAKTMAKYDFKEIVTTDPHAYNVIRNEYPKLGFEYPIRHYTQFLSERIEEIRPRLTYELRHRVAYHDPCALGRAHDNQVFEEPRALIKALPGVELVEMSHNRMNTICCGGGGGGMWLDGFSWEQTKTRTSEWRIKEAIRAGAHTLAVACPFETPRFEDAAKNVGDGGQTIFVKDVAELLADAMFG